MTKPKKIIYPNQESIHKKIVSHLKSILPKEVSKAYIIGSLTKREFGKYESTYQEHGGSDIDVIAIIDHNRIPKEWKNLNTSKIWWDLYRIGELTINKTIHKIDCMVVKKGKEHYPKKRAKELNWKIEEVK
ncbi:hypothetical protein CMI47_02265 [Candidatus Pacearchaeota archaeon]|nr:hypothetical protein [Candidatus Pacearchaeota archaeon]|tara:strand:+ start:331 stop:723 length:393 start_codon:yes stop_codon:yes gene_type:complete